ncbi:hypothetical protein T4B_5577 [Trichinella pseudospiralis]|uniref:Uncharacterized protein n=2 Tax=Trichinella pseudospiralis TaxID=6337 RepID=A0A0V1ICT1_TRIPS|nr:hypothetical protein T4E_6809 [Trichinella pseudospiralis]KRY90429.1 hypothetical protein T4D_12309 [Trichinella pseudospiralis]KRZ20636.1 hypothetical protein T4B_5577 [Trichinella pseudospiralis]
MTLGLGAALGFSIERFWWTQFTCSLALSTSSCLATISCPIPTNYTATVLSFRDLGNDECHLDEKSISHNRKNG